MKGRNSKFHSGPQSQTGHLDVIHLFFFSTVYKTLTGPHISRKNYLHQSLKSWKTEQKDRNVTENVLMKNILHPKWKRLIRISDCRLTLVYID